MTEDPDAVRLNKFLAACGEGSRRACDDLIARGRVVVNGDVCVNPGTRVRGVDHVRVDGRRVAPRNPCVVALYKPRGLVCTRSDEHHRDTIYTVLPPMYRDLHHTGRLDLESEGLLILTNDGDLTRKLTQPRAHIEKEYFVTLNQAFETGHLLALIKGIHSAEGRLAAKHAEIISPRRLKIILVQGAKRQIRVMLDALGYKVTRLIRVRIGSLWLGELKPGEYAPLAPAEIERLTINPAPLVQAEPKPKPAPRLNRRATPKPKPAPKPTPKPTPAGRAKSRKQAVKRGTHTTRGANTTRQGRKSPKPPRR